MAAKGDYDAIAFTTGKQQTERYNLAKHIDELLVTKNDDGTFTLKATMPNGGATRDLGRFEADKLNDYVGHNLAENIKKQESVNDVYGANDLKVGGEGMKGFYDKMIPEYINKYAKKWGMGMKKANLASVEDQFADYTKWVIKEHPSLDYPTVKKSWLNKDDLFKEWTKTGIKQGEEVHFVDLSDMAKKEIKEKGQPLFAGIGALGGAEFMDGLDEQNKTGILKELMKTKK